MSDSALFSEAERRRLMDWIDGSRDARPVVEQAQEALVDCGRSLAYRRGYAENVKQWAEMVLRVCDEAEGDS